MKRPKGAAYMRSSSSYFFRKLFFYVSSCLFLVVSTIAIYGLVNFYRKGPHTFRAIIEVPKGATLRSLSHQLYDKNLLHSARSFYWVARLQGQGNQIKAGRYEIADGLSAAEIIEMLQQGRTLMSQLTVPEGLTNHQVYEWMKRHPDIDWNVLAEHMHDVPEGMLFPETYTFAPGTLASEILRAMYLKMESVLQELWAKRPADFPLKSLQEALILASIVEKETSLPSERPRVAQVFLNRLRKKMPLQADSTVIYALSNKKGLLGRLLAQKDLQTDHDHNTYKRKGLPPTPIANPSLSSLMAVFFPACGTELYFVADGCGGHRFATRLADHQKNVLLFRKKLPLLNKQLYDDKV